jgi:integrase
MRKGEIEYLMWTDLNFDLGIVFIQAKPDVGWQPKTDERVIPMSPTVQQLLFEQVRESNQRSLGTRERPVGIGCGHCPRSAGGCDDDISGWET